MICLIVSVIKYQIVILSGNLTRHSRSFTEPTSLIKLTPGAFFCRQVGPRFRKVAPRLKFLNFYLSPGAPSPTNNLSEKKNYFRRKVSYYDEKKKMPLVDHRIVALPKRPPFAPGLAAPGISPFYGHQWQQRHHARGKRVSKRPIQSKKNYIFIGTTQPVSQNFVKRLSQAIIPPFPCGAVM